MKDGSEINPKDLLEMLFFQNFNFQYFRDISDSASKRQEYKHRVLDQEKLAAIWRQIILLQSNAMLPWNSGINSTGILNADWLTAPTHVIIQLINAEKNGFHSLIDWQIDISHHAK